MSEFRKKPVVIHAERCEVLIRDANHAWESLPGWFRGAYDAGKVVIGTTEIRIVTLEGVMRGEWDDWIICGVKGELYPCKPNIFAETYEPVLAALAAPQEGEAKMTDEDAIKEAVAACRRLYAARDGCRTEDVHVAVRCDLGGSLRTPPAPQECERCADTPGIVYETVDYADGDTDVIARRCSCRRERKEGE